MIAEGIETAEQLGHLRALGCCLGQGYLLARPLTADAAAATLAAERRWPAADATPSEYGRFQPTGYGERRSRCTERGARSAPGHHGPPVSQPQ